MGQTRRPTGAFFSRLLPPGTPSFRLLQASRLGIGPSMLASGPCWWRSTLFGTVCPHQQPVTTTLLFSLGGSEEGVSCRCQSLAEVGAGSLCLAGRLFSVLSLIVSGSVHLQDCLSSGEPHLVRKTLEAVPSAPVLSYLGAANSFQIPRQNPAPPTPDLHLPMITLQRPHCRDWSL